MEPNGSFIKDYGKAAALKSIQLLYLSITTKAYQQSN